MGRPYTPHINNKGRLGRAMVELWVVRGRGWGRMWG